MEKIIQREGNNKKKKKEKTDFAERVVTVVNKKEREREGEKNRVGEKEKKNQNDFAKRHPVTSESGN